jgi:signal transduction histidine kinase
MKRTVIEPALLQFLQLYALLLLLVQPLSRRLLAEGFAIEVPLGIYIVLATSMPLFLVIYTRFAWWRRLGRLFLPIALLVIAVGVLAEKSIILQWFIPPDRRELVTLLLMLRLWIVFQVLLLFVAWHYTMAQVALSALALTLLDAWLSFPFIDVNSPLYPLFVVLVGARMLSVTGVGTGLAWLIARQREQQQALAEAHRQLAHYATTVEQLAVSHERNRMARELHDTLAHSLSGVTVQLEAVDALWEGEPTAARALLAQARQGTRNGLAEARHALQSLRATPLVDLGLALALSTLARSTAARAGLQLELTVPQHLEGLPAPTEQCVYRVAQEALTNAVRHARASRVQVALVCKNGDLTLTVADDGCGFDPAAIGDAHFGVQGMRERAELLGASLAVDSAPQRGTTVRLTIAV